MSSNAHATQTCIDYAVLRTSWTEVSTSLPPSSDDYRSFARAITNADFAAIELHLKNWCTDVSDGRDFLALTNFVSSVKSNMVAMENSDSFQLAVFKGIWQAFYSAVSGHLSKLPDSSFEDLIAVATSVMTVVDSCMSIAFPGIQSCQTENTTCALVAQIWSHLANTIRLNSKLVNSLPWRDILVCFTQQLIGSWTYNQSDEILHAFLINQLRFCEYVPATLRVMEEWAAFQSNKEDFERNYVACVASLDTAKGAEKNLSNLLTSFKTLLENFDPEIPPAGNKPKKDQSGGKAYSQLGMMNDIQSLRRVLHYLSLTRSFRQDADDEDASSGLVKVLLVERVLQVTGESTKNTTGSPNLSVKKRKALEKAKVPLNTLSALRNALSHYNYLSVEKKTHLENRINLQSVQIELTKLEDVFAKALRRIEFTLLLECVREEAKNFAHNSAEAQFFNSLLGCRSFAEIEDKLRGRMSDGNVRQLRFLIQQFDIQANVCKMESLFSTISAMDVKHGNTANVWRDLDAKKREVAKSTLSEVSEMKNIEELLQDLSMSTGNVKPIDARNGSSAKATSYGHDFLEKFIDALACKYMSREFYTNVAQELFLGADFPLAPVVIEALLDTYGEKEFATKEDKARAVSALRILDAVLHLKYTSVDNRSTAYVNGRPTKEVLDGLLDLVANAHFQPVTDVQVDVACGNIGISDSGVHSVMRIILQDMFESIPDETDHGIYTMVEKVISMCCPERFLERLQESREDLTVKVARLKLASHMKAIASKKEGLLTAEEFNCCKSVVNNALTVTNSSHVQSVFDCRNGRLRESDLKVLKNMVSSFEKLCGRLKETKALEDSVKVFKEYLAEMDMHQDDLSAAVLYFRSIQQEGLEAFVFLRFKQLKLLLEKYKISAVAELSDDSCAKYKCNHYLRASVEMILLECLEILDNLYTPPCQNSANGCCNFTLRGAIGSADLRNYLAHGNSLLEFKDSDITYHVLMNAVELVGNGECIMALRKLFEVPEIYGFIKLAVANEELHAVHVGTIAHLATLGCQTTVERLQSNPNWEDVVKKYFEIEAKAQGSIPRKQAGTFGGQLTLSASLMAEDARNLMLRNHVNQFSVLVRANPLICKHSFRNSWTLLHYAMSLKENGIHAIDVLLASDADVNATDDRSLTPLHLAVLFKSRDGVEKLLSHKNVDVDARDMDGVTALHIAVQQGALGIVQLLCSGKANLNIQTNKKWTALHFAVSYGHESVVRLLLRDGANPNVVGEDRWTPLLLAAYHNRAGLVKILLGSGADAYAILVDDPLHTSMGAIHLAASTGGPECIQLLLDKGVSVNLHCPDYRYGNKRRPLHFAAMYGKEDNVRFLLSHPDVDLNADGTECTAVDYAMRYGHVSIVTLLLQHDCKLNPNAIIDAAAKGNLEILKLLHERGANLDASIRGFHFPAFTPAVAATLAGKLDVLKFLLSAVKCDIDMLMHTACMFGCRSAAQYLIEEKYFPDPGCCYRESKETPLHTAAENDRLSMVRYLVEDLSLCIDLCDSHGNTPCMLAARNNKWAVVNYCMKRGADVSGERGGWIARIAAFCGQWSLAQELISKGASLGEHWEGGELNGDMAVAVTAACKGRLGMLNYLIDKQNLDVKALPRQPFLALLAAHAKQNTLHYLSLKGLEMTSACDQNGATGLHLSALAGNLEALTFFLDVVSCPVDQVDTNGCSALHYAVRGKRLDIVRDLLGRNANAATKNHEGKSPLVLALEVRDYDVIYCLAHHKDLLASTFPDEEGVSFLQRLTKADCCTSDKYVTWLEHKSTDVFHKSNAGETVLHFAVNVVHSTDILFFILKKGKEASDGSVFSKFLNCKDVSGNSALMLFVKKAHNFIVFKAVELLLKYKPDLNVQNCQQQTVLHLAVERRNADALWALQQPLAWFQVARDKSTVQVADPFLRNCDGLTPLEMAQKIGIKEWIDKLLHYEGSYKFYVLQDEAELARIQDAQAAYNASKLTANPLSEAALRRDVHQVKFLLETQPCLQSMPTYPGNRPIHLAARGGCVDVLQCLIAAGSDAGSVNDLGENTLHVAASCGHVNAVDYLVRIIGLDCNLFDRQGNKAVHSAVRSGKLEVFIYFFQNGLTDVDDVDENNATSLQIAAEEGRDEVIEYLLAKYDAGTSPLGNSTLLNEAIWNDHLSTVKLLLDKGAVAEVMKTGLACAKSPLYMAIKNEYWSIAKLLMESVTQDELKFFLADNGAALLEFAAASCQLDVVTLLVEKAGLDLNVPSERGQTPLMAACCLGKVDVVRYLLSRNANPNSCHYSTKSTALHNAARLGRAEAARVLIDYHCDLMAEDREGDTPLTTAAKFGRWDVAVAILSNAGQLARELYGKLAVRDHDELKRHAVSKGIAIDFNSFL